MESILMFINDNILIISFIIYVWFAVDCKKYKRFFTNKFDWLMFYIYAGCSIKALHEMSQTEYLFKGLL